MPQQQSLDHLGGLIESIGTPVCDRLIGHASLELSQSPSHFTSLVSSTPPALVQGDPVSAQLPPTSVYSSSRTVVDQISKTPASRRIRSGSAVAHHGPWNLNVLGLFCHMAGVLCVFLTMYGLCAPLGKYQEPGYSRCVGKRVGSLTSQRI